MFSDCFGNVFHSLGLILQSDVLFDVILCEYQLAVSGSGGGERGETGESWRISRFFECFIEGLKL